MGKTKKQVNSVEIDIKLIGVMPTTVKLVSLIQLI
jgi:hypothetical protein